MKLYSLSKLRHSYPAYWEAMTRNGLPIGITFEDDALMVIAGTECIFAMNEITGEQYAGQMTTSYMLSVTGYKRGGMR